MLRSCVWHRTGSEDIAALWSRQIRYGQQAPRIPAWGEGNNCRAARALGKRSLCLAVREGTPIGLQLRTRAQPVVPEHIITCYSAAIRAVGTLIPSSCFWLSVAVETSSVLTDAGVRIMREWQHARRETHTRFGAS